MHVLYWKLYEKIITHIIVALFVAQEFITWNILWVWWLFSNYSYVGMRELSILLEKYLSSLKVIFKLFYINSLCECKRTNYISMYLQCETLHFFLIAPVCFSITRQTLRYLNSLYVLNFLNIAQFLQEIVCIILCV